MNKLIAFVLALALALTLVGCNKNKHSLRGFLYASGAMLILYQSKKTASTA